MEMLSSSHTVYHRGQHLSAVLNYGGVVCGEHFCLSASSASHSSLSQRKILFPIKSS